MAAYVVGVDGCSEGWLAMRYCPAEGKLAPRVVATFEAILARYPDARCVAIDIPIGLTEDCHPRICDGLARRYLGRRRNSVFPAPDRRILTLRSYPEASATFRSLCGKGIPRQAFALHSKIAEVDRLMSPQLQAWVVEVHPEVCFWALAGGRPMDHYKKTPEGFQERRQLLTIGLEGVPIPDWTEASVLARPAEPDDVLDAVAAAWTAFRVAEGHAERLPANPPTDAKGLRMEMVY